MIQKQHKSLQFSAMLRNIGLWTGIKWSFLNIELQDITQPQTNCFLSRQFNEINCISHFNNIASENVLCLFYITLCSFMLKFPLIHSFFQFQNNKKIYTNSQGNNVLENTNHSLNIFVKVNKFPLGTQNSKRRNQLIWEFQIAIDLYR